MDAAGVIIVMPAKIRVGPLHFVKREEGPCVSSMPDVCFLRRLTAQNPFVWVRV
jgi:hypothetical protein